MRGPRGARVISFSGPDGSGKSTQIELLAQELRRMGQRPVVLWTRLGYTPGFELAKAALRRVLRKKLPQRGETGSRDRMMKRSGVQVLWLGVACADLLLTYGVVVRALPWLGRSVICDRFLWDALIDRAQYFPDSPWVDQVLRHGYAVLGRTPDLAVLLTLPLDEAERRSLAKNEPFPDPPQRRAARHAHYQALVKDHAVRAIDAARPPQDIATEIAGLVRRT